MRTKVSDASLQADVEAFSKVASSTEEQLSTLLSMDLPAKTQLMLQDMLRLYRQTLDEYMDLFTRIGRMGGASVDSLAVHKLQSCVLPADSASKRLISDVEQLAKETVGVYSDAFKVCSGVAPASANAQADVDGDNAADKFEFAFCVLAFLPEIGTKVAQEYNAAVSTGEYSLTKLLAREFAGAIMLHLPETTGLHPTSVGNAFLNATFSHQAADALLQSSFSTAGSGAAVSCYDDCARYEKEARIRPFVHYSTDSMSRVTSAGGAGSYNFRGPDRATTLSSLDGACYVFIPHDCEPKLGADLFAGFADNEALYFVAGKYNLEQKSAPFGLNAPWTSISNQWCGSAMRTQYAAELATRKNELLTMCYNTTDMNYIENTLGRKHARDLEFFDDVGFSGPRKCSAEQCQAGVMAGGGRVSVASSAEGSGAGGWASLGSARGWASGMGRKQRRERRRGLDSPMPPR